MATEESSVVPKEVEEFGVSFPQAINLWHMYTMSQESTGIPVSADAFLAELKQELDDHNQAREGYLYKQQEQSVAERDSSRLLVRRILPSVVEKLETVRTALGLNSQVKDLMHSIDIWELAYLTTRVMLNSAQEDTPFSRVCEHIGTEVQKQASFVKFREQHPGMFLTCLNAMRSMNYEFRERCLGHYFNRFGCSLTWPKEVLVKCGLYCSMAFVEISGLVEIKVIAGPRSPAVVRFTKIAEQFCEDTTARISLLKTWASPMYVPPVPWTSLDIGGFILNGLIRADTFVRSNVMGRMVIQNSPTDLSSVFQAANTLQRTAWRVNEFIYNTLKEAESNDILLGIVPRLQDLVLPEKPWDEEGGEKPSESVLKGWKKQAAFAYYHYHSQRTLRHQYMRKMQIAQKAMGREIFFCWSCDFRGRLNVIQNWLSPQSDDIGKALLQFHNEQPLTRGGRASLEIHVANMYGKDKLSYGDRISWVQANIRNIMDAVESPLSNTWWREADKPMLFLASARDLLRGLRGEPIGTCVAADGSCNGLQHLAAMGGDESGAEATNVVQRTPDFSAPPSDVYSMVLKDVRKLLVGSFSDTAVAEAIDRELDRKMIKRNVMTTPYSVTARGMRAQVQDEMRRRPHGDLLVKACANVSGAVEKVRGTLLAPSMEVMEWLKSLSRFLNSKELPVVWTTPSGFKVIQMYRKGQIKAIHMTQAKHRIEVSATVGDRGLNKHKQVLGIAPNFVHSMDASHLVLTINKANTSGIEDFGMVHDSYGTHANQVALLGDILRETFLSLYSTDQLKAFKESLEKASGLLLPEPPKKGGLNLEKVLQSPYFFSNAPTEVLAYLINTQTGVQNG